jgi:hypothetical protein
MSASLSETVVFYDFSHRHEETPVKTPVFRFSGTLRVASFRAVLDQSAGDEQFVDSIVNVKQNATAPKKL